MPDEETHREVIAPELAPRPLSIEEIRSLSDRGLHAERSAPLSLAGRFVSGLTISEIDWVDSWESASIERATLRTCSFSGHELGQAVYRDVTFEDCSFEHCSFVQATFEGCRFVGCTFRSGSVSTVTFQDCRFVECRLSCIIFQDARLDGVSVEGGSMLSVRFAKCKLHFLAFRGVDLDAIRFTLCEAGRLLLSHCDARRLTLLGGTWGIIEAERGQFSELSLAQVSVRELRMTDVDRLARFGIAHSLISKLSLARCLSSGMYWTESELTRFVVMGGRYEGWVTDSCVGAGSAITGAELASVFWDQTRLLGITFAQVSFTNFICARGAKFANMRLVNVTYAPKLRIVLDGARFADSDSFGDSEGNR